MTVLTVKFIHFVKSYYSRDSSENDAFPQPNHTHTMWRIRRARYTNASSVAKKLLCLQTMIIMPIVFLPPT